MMIHHSLPVLRCLLFSFSFSRTIHSQPNIRVLASLLRKSPCKAKKIIVHAHNRREVRSKIQKIPSDSKYSMTMCQRSVTGGSEFIPVPVPGREMLRLLPMLSSLKVTFVNDNAKRPAHSVSEEKRRRTPVKKTLSKSRWESTAKFVTVLPTQGAILKDAVCDTIDSDEVRKPSRRPSINEEALSKVSTMFVDDDCDSWSPTSVTKAAHLAHSRADSAFRSSIEARKPCRQPSLDQDVRQQLAQFADEFDDDSAEETVKRSSLSLRKPSRAPSLSRVQEGMNESTQSLQEILGVIQAEFGDKFANE
mmetsp:Transcript_15577/g.29451  ORF Transcript_15577/g.29451 Transcript_15577/m.29451 type:complete len:306 (+) Transcript_15577:106-1023(+)